MNKSIRENFSLARPVALIGMMGAGKTSVGRALARLLDVGFFDADREIEKAAGQTVAEIFAAHGEAEFRRLERKVIERLLKNASCILSLGGGAFMDAQTRAQIKKSALSVWLKVERDLLLDRVQRKGDRPMLKGGDIRDQMLQLLTEREAIYAQADLTVLCDDSPVPQTARRVRQALQAAPAFQNR